MLSRHSFHRLSKKAIGVFILIVALLIYRPAFPRTNELYIFVETDETFSSANSGLMIEAALSAVLREGAFFNWQLKVVDSIRRGDRSVNEYVSEKRISHYVRVNVQEIDAGFNLQILLVSNKTKRKDQIVLGKKAKNDMSALKLRLMKIPIVYDAIVRNFSPENLVFVDCFKCPKSSDAITVTLELPYHLENASLRSRKYPVHGMTEEEFNNRCVEGLKTGDRGTFKYNYRISGNILNKEDGSQSANLKINVRIKVKGLPYLVPWKFTVGRDSVTEKLAEYIVGRWEELGHR